MKKNRIFNEIKTFIVQLTSMLLLSTGNIFSQSSQETLQFPELIMTEIPGAPRLSAPFLITGKNLEGVSEPIVSRGFGIAAPAYYDWDGDGLKDLLVGEFGSGAEHGRPTGNFIRVYLNTGTESEPQFATQFDYARPAFEMPINGTPYSVDQFCCMSFTPKFVDLNGDGRLDMTSGQYFGEVIGFYGTEKGFLPGEIIKQQGDPRQKRSKASQAYWLYSSAGFGDFDDDGKQDMIIGGRALRISTNIGSINEPHFSKRELLYDINNKPLKVYDFTPEELLQFKYIDPFIGGDSKLSPVVVDWDNDGVLDLLVTNSYDHKGLETIDFFKGKKIGGQYKFETAVPLFKSNKGKKAFPGISPIVSVIDWNNDGVKDLLIGVSIVTINDKISNSLSWNWESEMNLHGIGKDPMNIETISEEDMKDVKLPPDISMRNYLTMKHVGNIYVMLGSKKNADETKNK